VYRTAAIRYTHLHRTFYLCIKHFCNNIHVYSPSLLYTQRLFTETYTDFCKRHIAGFLVGLDTTEKLVLVSSRVIVLPKILQRVFQKRLCTELYHSIIRSTAKMYSMIRQVAVRNPSKKRTSFSRQVVM
jgi:hypothetical protein